MYSLSHVRKLLSRQWFQSALLHGALLLCAVLYHLHSRGSLHFSANSFDQTGTSAVMILNDNNIDFLDLSFEQYDMTEPQLTAAKRADAAITASNEVPLDATTDIATAKATEPVVFRDSGEKQTMTSKSASQRVAPARSARASTQSTAHPSPSASHVAVQPTQTARPDHAHSPKPFYPLALRDLGVSGVVWLRVWVDDTGRPREIELAKGSGYRLFDEAALRAVQHWRFVPAKNEQHSLASWVEFAVRFQING
ncbi:MAG: hypothetical protein CK528_02145 [Alcaligenaceae bacterium]|nr:MAG: hypothetical protein CK528_02145 [Alcaligenaceae bacterium]